MKWGRNEGSNEVKDWNETEERGRWVGKERRS